MLRAKVKVIPDEKPGTVQVMLDLEADTRTHDYMGPG